MESLELVLTTFLIEVTKYLTESIQGWKDFFKAMVQEIQSIMAEKSCCRSWWQQLLSCLELSRKQAEIDVISLRSSPSDSLPSSRPHFLFPNLPEHCYHLGAKGLNS